MLSKAIAKHAPTVVDELTFNETTSGGNVFLEWMPDTPDTAVAVMTQPGLPQLSKRPVDLPGVQFLVRGEREADPADSHALATELYAAFNCLDGVALDEGGNDEVWVAGCTALQSGPTYLGRDSNDRPEWSLNLTLRVHAPTTHRSA